jgi:hypothetical protein
LPGSHSASSHAHTNDRQGRLVLRRHVQRNRWPTQHEKADHHLSADAAVSPHPTFSGRSR